MKKKMGHISNRATLARHTTRESRKRKDSPVGRVWYKHMLDDDKERHKLNKKR